MEVFAWNEHDNRLSAMEDLVLTAFQLFCIHGDNCVTRLSKDKIQKYFPRFISDFYQKCAPSIKFNSRRIAFPIQSIVRRNTYDRSSAAVKYCGQYRQEQ